MRTNLLGQSKIFILLVVSLTTSARAQQRLDHAIETTGYPDRMEYGVSEQAISNLRDLGLGWGALNWTRQEATRTAATKTEIPNLHKQQKALFIDQMKKAEAEWLPEQEKFFDCLKGKAKLPPLVLFGEDHSDNECKECKAGLKRRAAHGEFFLLLERFGPERIQWPLDPLAGDKSLMYGLEGERLSTLAPLSLRVFSELPGFLQGRGTFGDELTTRRATFLAELGKHPDLLDALMKDPRYEEMTADERAPFVFILSVLSGGLGFNGDESMTAMQKITTILTNFARNPKYQRITTSIEQNENFWKAIVPIYFKHAQEYAFSGKKFTPKINFSELLNSNAAGANGTANQELGRYRDFGFVRNIARMYCKAAEEEKPLAAVMGLLHLGYVADLLKKISDREGVNLPLRINYPQKILKDTPNDLVNRPGIPRGSNS